jgi:hypothetical protein
MDAAGENGSAGGYQWDRDRVLREWPPALEYTQRNLMTDRTTIRLAFLRGELLPLIQSEGFITPNLFLAFLLMSDRSGAAGNSGRLRFVDQDVPSLCGRRVQECC